ncbi:MAG TPA: ETEC_3214 domain-containing protein [Cellvibrionaceae bacterium]
MSEENTVQKSKKPLLVLVGLVGLVAIGLLAALLHKMPTNVLSGKDVEALTLKLNQLKLGVDISYFNQRLGEPKLKENKNIKVVSYKIQWHATPKKKVRDVPYMEYFYSNPHFYVQAVANEAGIVEFYSITVRSEQFQPKIATGLTESLELGKSVYQSLPKFPFKIAGRLAETPKNAAYYEVYAIESKVQRLEVFSSNPNGFLKDLVPLDEKKEGFLTSKFSEETPFPITPVHDTFRKTTVINTYSAATAEFEGIDTSADGMNYEATKFTFGPRSDQLDKLQ